MWEFVSGHETVDDWTTLITIIDRPDAHTREDLDRLASGIQQTYESNGGRILAARTLVGNTGVPFNYLAVEFEEAAKHRYDLNFVKCALGARNAYIAVYGVRITDPKDYAGKAKRFLDQHAVEVGTALGSAAFPDTGKLPRREF